MTEESHKEAIKRVLKYIDRNKEEKMTLDDLAKVAHISKYHFHRLFRGYIGVSLGQYIKLKRIERSMRDLTFGDQNILDVALSSGYENHASFVKAFKKELGCTPTEFRKMFKENRMKFMSKLRNKEPKLLEIVERAEIKTNYVREMGSYFESPSRAWKKVWERIREINLDWAPLEFYSMSLDNPHEEGIEEKNQRFDAHVAAPKHEELLDKLNFEKGLIAGGKYAVFCHIGPYETLGDSFHYIFAHWVYKEDKKLRNVPAFIQLDYKIKVTDEHKRQSKIFIPIQ